jgi:hypothetical protein
VRGLVELEILSPVRLPVPPRPLSSLRSSAGYGCGPPRMDILITLLLEYKNSHALNHGSRFLLGTAGTHPTALGDDDGIMAVANRSFVGHVLHF